MPRHLQRYRPNHPRASASGCVWAHVDVAERALGKVLPDGAEVHHVDGNPHNNDPRNLVVCQDHAYHALLHIRTRILKAGGNPNTHLICSTCRQLKPIDEFNRSTARKATGRQNQCRACSHAYTKTYERRATA